MLIIAPWFLQCIDGVHEGIKKAKQVTDRRVMVLVMAGFFLLLPHLGAPLISLLPGSSPPNLSDQKLAWFDPADIRPQGLYWSDNGSREGSEKIFSQSIALPAQVAPILFLPIPINQAGRDTLMSIPGIGDTIASAIITYRDREGRINDKKSLMKIEGIGAKKADLIEKHVSFD